MRTMISGLIAGCFVFCTACGPSADNDGQSEERQKQPTKEKVTMSPELESQIQTAMQEWLDHWEQGPTRLHWTTVPVQIGDNAPDVELPDASGSIVRLSEFWSERPALILFWRHFGCGCGIERAERLQEEYKRYVQAGANVVIVGQGEPERAAIYIDQYNIPAPVLCDPEFESYQAYGLLEGRPSQFAFGEGGLEFIRLDNETRAKFANESREAGRPWVDNPFQLPGEFVVDRNGVIQLAYRYNYCDDFPDPDLLVTTIQEVVEGPSE